MIESNIVQRRNIKTTNVCSIKNKIGGKTMSYPTYQ